jgi:corrinoid protein of di/trimethylamine methyltransferase
MSTREDILAGLAKAVIDGDPDTSKVWAQKALNAHMDAYEALTKGCQEGMKVVGDRYTAGTMFIPEILLSAEALYAAMDVLRPYIKVQSTVPASVVIGVIEGDVHDIGKNIVKMMLEASSVKVYDLGRDVPIDAFVAKAKETNANVIAMSSLMTTTMFKMKDVVDMLVEEGLRSKVKVMVGGAPTSQAFAQNVGADAYAVDATEAVKAFEKLMKGA